MNLSRRRAEAVQTYLVAQHNVPVFRIQIVGLGKDKPVNDQKTRDDREKNRRVEVTVFNGGHQCAGQEFGFAVSVEVSAGTQARGVDGAAHETSVPSS